jgi:hypothetical protein
MSSYEGIRLSREGREADLESGNGVEQPYLLFLLQHQPSVRGATDALAIDLGEVERVGLWHGEIVHGKDRTKVSVFSVGAAREYEPGELRREVAGTRRWGGSPCGAHGAEVDKVRDGDEVLRDEL